MDKKYCFQCNKENEYYIKQEYDEYELHGVEFKVKQNNYYCAVCNDEIDGGNMQEKMDKMCLGYLEHFGLSYDKLIKIRKRYNLTQEEFSKVLGWSNKSIVRYEKGQSLPQREYINTYLELEMNPYKLFYMVENQKEALGSSYNAIIDKFKCNNYCKGLYLLLYFLNKKNLYKTQITKYSFYSDYLNKKNNNNKISYFKYIHAPFGPLIDNFDELLNDLIQAEIVSVSVDDDDKLMLKSNINCNIDMFTKDELSVMEEVYKKLGNKSSNELSKISHEFIGWKNTIDGEIIDEKYANDLII